MNDLTIIIASIGGLFLIIYFICTFLGNRSKPDLLEAISLLLTSSGIVSALKLGYISLFESALFIGALEDQRIPVLVGAFAIMWVSVNVTWKLFTTHIQFESGQSSEGA